MGPGNQWVDASARRVGDLDLAKLGATIGEELFKQVSECAPKSLERKGRRRIVFPVSPELA